MVKKKPTTLIAIADELGLSPTTVSRVLAGKAEKYRISKKTAQRVRELARRLDFQPNQAARSLRTRRTSTIGVIVPDISNPYFSGVVRSVATEAQHHGFSIFLGDSRDTIELEADAIRLFQSHSAAGIILCPVGTTAEHLLDTPSAGLPVTSLRTPTVLIDRNLPELKLPFVGSDNFGGAKEATQYLFQRGHRQIVCMQGLRGTTPNEERVRGYRTAHEELGIACDERRLVGGGFGEQAGYVETKLLVTSGVKFSAIFALSNMIALGALRALAEERLRVPQDVSMIAFDDQPHAPFLAAPMTSVAQQNQEMGQIAVRLLLDQMEKETPTTGGSILLPTRLIERASVSTRT